jgi:hypothetical protein
VANINTTYIFKETYLLNGPQQGNVDAAYAFTMEFDALVGLGVSIGGEAPNLLSGKSGQKIWDEAKGSFYANGIGVWEAMKEQPIKSTITVVGLVGRLVPH